MKNLLTKAMLFLLPALSAMAQPNASVTPSATNYTATAGSIALTVTLSYTDPVSSLGFNITLPAGWTYGGLTGAVPFGGDGFGPNDEPRVGDTGELGFLYVNVPASPVIFTITVNYPAGLTGNQRFTGMQGIFRPGPVIKSVPDLEILGVPPPIPIVSVVATDATAGEPATGQGPGTFTFSRTGATTAALTVNYTVSGTATSGSDYTAIGTTVTFAAGSATATQTVSVIDDALVESGETVIVTLAADTGYTVGSPSSDTVTIQDDDATVTVAAADATAGEPLTGQGGGLFTFTRTGFVLSSLTVNFTVGGTATSGSDYTALGTSVDFLAGANTANLQMNVIDDALIEGDETVVLNLAAGTGYVVGSPSSATVNIQDDDFAPAAVTVAATDATSGEPGTGQGTGTFTFTRTGPTTAALTVNYTVGGTAASGTDYTSIGTSVIIPAGSATATQTVSVLDDAIVETSETVILTLAAGTGYVVGSPSSDTVTIQDDDLPIVSVVAADDMAGEPLTLRDSGRFTFSRTGPTTSPLTVNYTVGGTATPGSDYTALGTSVVIPAGSASVSFNVIVLNDPDVEPEETVVLTLSGGTGYTVDVPPGNTATVTIFDDDATVTVAASDANAGEPGSGQGNGAFTVTRTGFVGAALTVNFSVGGTATSGSDYTAIGTSVVIPATQASVDVPVSVLNDSEVEGSETVGLTLLAGNYALGSPSTATVTIQDDDVATVTVAATDATAGEPLTGQGTGIFTITRTGPTTAAMTVNYTVGGTATSGSDYTAIGTSVIIPASSASATVTVSVSDDTSVEGDETVVLTLAAGTGYAVGSPSAATVTIQDDDATVAVAATDATAGEPGTGQGGGTFTFTRTGFTGAALTVNYTVGGTATSGSDYTAIGTTVNFAAASATATVPVSVLDDTSVEGDETVVLTLAAGTGYTVGSPASATVTIQDDDVASVTVAATDAAAGEPLTGQGTGTFTISRTGPTTAAMTVNYTVGGTATSGSDYTAIGTSVIIPASSASATVTVSVSDDTSVEGDETVVLTLAAGTGYAVGSPSAATVTIQDDDATVAVAATDATAGEPGTGQGGGTFTFTRTGFTGAALTVNYTVGGTATSGSDYTAIGTTVNFAAASATATVPVSVLDDTSVEGDETVVLTLAAGTGYAVGSPSAATVTIQDDDANVAVAATDATAGEPGTGQGGGTFTFTRTGFTGAALTVNYTVGGTATSGSDYTAIGTTVNFAAASATATVPVSVLDDASVEGDETVVLTLAAGTGYTVGSPASATVTIQDDDVASVTVAATDAAAGEPLTGQGTGTFTISRTGPTTAAMTVNYTVGGTATSGSDYTAIGTSVIIPASSASATVTVSVSDDTSVEGDETVVLTLAAGTGYAVGSPSAATVTIQDDDATVAVAATDATAGEPGTGQGGGTFTFTRTGFTGAALTVNYTVGGTATSGSDYTAIGTTVNFAAASATATVPVSVLDDTSVEGDETVVLTLAAGTGYTVGSPASATVTIQDDDVASVTVAATDAAAGEPLTGQGTGTFTISRTGPTTAAMTVNYTVGGTATSGSDYTAIGTSVIIPAGSASATVTVSVLDDPSVEGDETVVLTLAAGTGYSVGSPSAATVTIQDDDATVAVAATDATAGEPGTGQDGGIFTLTRTGFAANALTVNYTVGGTATSGSDYTAIGTTVNFTAGSATATVSVSVLDDTSVEGDETVVLTLAAGTGYTVGSPASATVTIQDDDVPVVTVAATDATAGEPLTAQGTGTFTITRTGPTTAAMTVNYTIAGTATSGGDFTAIGTSVIIQATQASATVTVNVIDDTVVEGDETVVLTLAAGTGYSVGSPSSATVTIRDDDATVTVAATDAAAGEPGAGQDGGTFTLTRTGSTENALTVNTTVGGTATSGSDYTAIGTTVNFAAGSATATVSVSVLDDTSVEGDETVVLTLAAGTGYTVGSPSSATVTIQDDDFTITALVRHAPVVNGSLDGSVQMLLGENVSLNGTAMISGDLLVPGTPTVQVGASATYGGTLDGGGATSPAGYSVMLNDSALLRHVVRRIDPIALPVVSAPPAPAGTRIVSLTIPTQSAGDFTTIRNLSLNASAGPVIVPPGTYGSFSASGNSALVLGVPGATVPSVYNFQSLALNILPGTAQLQIVGPVIINLAIGSLMNGAIGSLAHPEWLTLTVATGGLTLSGNGTFNGNVIAPSSAITLNGNATLNGTVVADRLTINGTSLLNDPNQ